MNEHFLSTGSKNEVPDYLYVVGNNRELRSMREMLMSRVTDVMHKTNKLKSAHLKHAYLWTESRLVPFTFFER